MKREFPVRAKSVVATLLVTSLLGSSATLLGCAASVSGPQPVPEIPKVPQVTSELQGVLVTMQPFVDARLPAIQHGKTNRTITQPDDGATDRVEESFKQALTNQGVVITPSSRKLITGEIRRWDSVSGAAATGVLESNATLFIEVKDTQGGSKFAGEYHGSRSSSFPIIAKQDIGDSLGLAMAEAIEQALRDPNLRRYLR